MKIGILSDCKSPTVGEGGHGLGRVAVDLARGMSHKHEIVLYGAEGSAWGGDVETHTSEHHRAIRLTTEYTQRRRWACDVFIDLSHKHALSELSPHAPVINYLMDFECPYSPPNAVIANEGLRWKVPTAERVPLGLNLSEIPRRSPFRAKGDYAAFAAKIHAHKGYDLAIDVCAISGVPLQMAGQNLANERLVNWRDCLMGEPFYDWLGAALVHLAPYRRDAGSRVALEAAALGVPTLTFDRTATQYHVEQGVTGWIVRDVREMAEAMREIDTLMRVNGAGRMREWVRSTHSLRVMCDGIERLCERVMDGDIW